MSSPFDLRRFSPPAETTFTLSRGGDQVYAVPGDPEVDDVAKMLRIENVIRGIDEGDPVEAFSEGKALLLRMVQECQPEVESLKIGAQELVIVFALIVKGPTVAEAVRESIMASVAAEDAAREPGDESAHKEGEDGPETAEVTPLPLAAHSSTRSSDSASETAGLPATGTG